MTRGTAPVARATRRISLGGLPPIAPELHLVARIGAERFAFPAPSVDEVVDAPRVAWLPGAPAGLVGDLRHRGRTVSVWDGGQAFGLATAASAGAALVLRHGARRLALLVDDVEDLLTVEPESVRPVPSGADADGLLRGIAQVRWRDADRLIGLVRVSELSARTLRSGAAGEGGP